MEYIKAHLGDKMVLHGKVGFVAIATDDDEKTETAACDVCGKEYTYVPDKLYPVEAVACKDCKTDWIPPVRSEPVAATLDDRPETCPDCGGPRKGRGYAHSEDCPTLPANKPVKTCDDCGGPASGKGYAHKPDCPTQQKKVVETCDKCGGPKRGRGFTHKDDCPEKQKSVKAKKPTKAKAKKRPAVRRPRL